MTTVTDQVQRPAVQRVGGVQVSAMKMIYRDRSGGEVTALRDIDLAVEPGEFCVLLGPSGCGKTTLLRCIAGLETPAEGRIVIDEKRAFEQGRTLLEPQRRPVGMVFQSYALWPHMSVAENVAYPITTGSRRERPSKSEISARVQKVLRAVQIDHLADRRIGQLSGGQQQRVALARAVAAGNKVVLFDEPLSNIDAKVREDLRLELKEMQKQLGFTAVYVTHDQVEALDLADKIVVLDHGEIVQVGSPYDVYFRPRTEHVASFVGTSNLLTGDVAAVLDEERVRVATTLGDLEVPGIGAVGDAVKVVARANAWRILPAEREARWHGELRSRRLLGAHTEYEVAIDGVSLRIWDDFHPWCREGDRVSVDFDGTTAWTVRDDSR